MKQVCNHHYRLIGTSHPLPLTTQKGVYEILYELGLLEIRSFDPSLIGFMHRTRGEGVSYTSMAGILDSDLTLQWRTDRNDIDSAQVGVAGFYTGGFALSLHQDPLSFTSTPIGELLTTVYSKLSCHSRPHCPISSQRPARDYERLSGFLHHTRSRGRQPLREGRPPSPGKRAQDRPAARCLTLPADSVRL